MRKLLRRWLGITELSSKLYEHELLHRSDQLQWEKKIADCKNQIDDLNRDANWLANITIGLLDHLKLDYYKSLEADTNYAPPQPRMREVVKLRKK